jgi:hypothetical protein
VATTFTPVRPANVPTPRRTPPSPPKQPSLPEVVETAFAPDLGEHDGVRILREEQVMNLPKAPFKGFVKIVLADDRELFRCTDCAHIDTRGGVISHRMKVHGQASAMSARKRAAEPRKAPAADLDPEIANLTVAELLQYAVDRANVAQVIEDLTTQRDEWKSRAQAAEMAERRIVGALDRIGYRRVDEEL